MPFSDFSDNLADYKTENKVMQHKSFSTENTTSKSLELWWLCKQNV